MKIASVLGMMGILSVIVACTGCAVVDKAAVVVVPVLEGVLCTLAEEQPNEPTWEVFLCTVAGDDNAPLTNADGGLVEPQGTASFLVKVPASGAKAFAAAHSGVVQKDGVR
jgi:hypothetical protein